MYCGNPRDDAEHTIFCCERWNSKREKASAKTEGARIDVETIIPLMLESEEGWKNMSEMIVEIMSQKEEDERLRQRGEGDKG